MPRSAAVYVHGTDHAASNRKPFYGELREDVLCRLSGILHKNKMLMRSFISLRHLIESKNTPNGVKFLKHIDVSVIMLLNIKSSFGHVNGTRYLAENMPANLLFSTFASGLRKGARLTQL